MPDLFGQRAHGAPAPRKDVIAAQKQLTSKGFRGELPGQYVIKTLVSIERDELSPRVSESELLSAKVRGRPVADHYVVETVLYDAAAVKTLERWGMEG